MDLETKDIIALKIINKRKCDKNEIEKQKLEAKILEELQHPNIVGFVHSKETQTRFFLAMELIKGGLLSKVINNKILSDNDAATLIEALFNAVH